MTPALPERQQDLELLVGHAPEAAPGASLARGVGKSECRGLQAAVADQLAEGLDADPAQPLGNLLGSVNPGRPADYFAVTEVIQDSNSSKARQDRRTFLPRT